MIRKLFPILFPMFLVSCFQTNEEQDKKAILSVLQTQELAWNNYDLEGFMQGYWKNDSLKFYGKNGLTYGWKQNLANYHQRYPSKEHTGELKFIIKDISQIDNTVYHVMGEYHLTRSVRNASGIFMILFKKIDGKWKVVADTSC